MPLHSADLDHSAITLAPTTGTAVWRVELLGGLRAFSIGTAPETNGGAHSPAETVEAFRTHKAALLLARFALFPHRAHARDELVELLWPDAPADRGRANLTQALVHLRAALHQPRTGGLFVADHKTVRVAKNALQTDVAEWETAAGRALQTAFGECGGSAEQADHIKELIAAYTGDLLPGFYDEWVEAERNRLADLRSDLHARLHSVEAERKARPASSQNPEAAEAENCAPTLRNAPLFLTCFFGRAAERRHLHDLLVENPPARLVTLLGIGGIGKTRLAVEVAQDALRRREDANENWAWAAFIPLDTAQTASQMESVLLGALGLQSKTEDGFAEAAAYLNARGMTPHGGQLLLVLDNLEQLDDSCAPLIVRLLTLVPRLTVLATSRQPVGIAGERELFLGPLPSEAAAERPVGEPESLPDAVCLFFDRARLARTGFAVTADNRDAVFKLCALLEGVPLALELAAAWMRVLTPVQIATRLKNRFDVLQLQGAFTKAGISKRHQSLRAAIAWSYDLLGPGLQTFWIQMSVFRGGWTAEAAQAVTGVAEVNEPLLLLAERSLILADADDATGTMRYRMVESLREFAYEQVGARGNEFRAALRLRHAQYFSGLTRRANELVETGRGMRPALALLAPERDNLRVLFARLQEQGSEPVGLGDETVVSFLQAAVRSAVQSHWLWPLNEARRHLTLANKAAALLPEAIALPLRASVLLQESSCSLYAGDTFAAERQGRDGLALWEMLQNQENVVAAKKQLALLAAQTGDWKEAVALWMDCLHFAQEAHNPHLEAGILNNLANHEGPDLAERQRWIERAVALDRTHAPGSHFLACSLNTMGSIAFEKQDWQTARACLEEAHAVAVSDGALGMMGVTKMSLAGLFCEIGEPLDQAEDLLCEAQALFEEKDEPLRVAQVHHLRFGVALKRGDGKAAFFYARDYLTVNRDARLMDEGQLWAAQNDLTHQLREAGYSAPDAVAVLIK